MEAEAQREAAEEANRETEGEAAVAANVPEHESEGDTEEEDRFSVPRSQAEELNDSRVDLDFDEPLNVERLGRPSESLDTSLLSVASEEHGTSASPEEYGRPFTFSDARMRKRHPKPCPYRSCTYF